MNKIESVKVLDKATEWCLYLLIFFLPFSKSMIEIAVVAGLVSLCAKKIITGDYTLRRTPINLYVAVFILAGMLSIINSGDKFFVMRSLMTKMLKYIVLYFIVVETIDSRIKFKNLITMAALSAAIVIIDSFIQYYVTHRDILRLYQPFKFVDVEIFEPGFPTGPFPFPNDLSAWVLIMLMPALYLLIWGPDNIRSRLTSFAFAGPLLFLLYLANTRSAWISFFASFFLSLFVQNKKILILIIMAAVIISIPFVPKERLGDITGLRSMEDRFYMWRIGWRVFTDHPVIGNGYNTFFDKFKQYREDEYRDKKGSYVHNGYLQLAADMGIIGLLAFLALLARAFISAAAYIRKSKDRFYANFALGLSAGLFAFLVHSFFDTNLQSLPLVTLFWFSLGVLICVPQVEKRGC